jgi:hypothetical protein
MVRELRVPPELEMRSLRWGAKGAGTADAELQVQELEMQC